MIHIHEASKSVVLNAPDPFHIRELLPKSRLITHADFNVAVQHTLESTKILRNIGFDVPAPIRYQYNWPGRYKPFDHQITMAEFHTLNRHCLNLSEMGTGKSAAALWAADWLMLTGRVKKCLILSPLSIVECVWKMDIFDVLMHRHAVVVHGTREQREKAMKMSVDFYILNHDGVSLPWLAEKIRKDPDINLVILDEASVFRNGSTMRYRALQKMLRPDMRLWLLTGTPCPNEPTDAWALAQLVSPNRVPKFFGAFKRQTMVQVGPYKWQPKPTAYTIAYDAMQPAVRFKKKDCLTLPPVTVQDRQAELTPIQKTAFKTMKNQMIAEMKNHQITAVNAADKIGKLRQILGGAIKDPKTEEYITIAYEPRLRILLEAIEQADAKAIVIVPFKGMLKSLTHEVSKHYSVGMLNGDVTPTMRTKIITAFKKDKDPHVLLCHPKVMAHGLNLTEADTTIFFAPIYSNDEYQQVIERFNRTGQKNKMTIVRIGAHPLEWEIYRLIDNRTITQDNILNLYQSIVSQ